MNKKVMFVAVLLYGFIAAASAEAARIGGIAWYTNSSGAWYIAGPGFDVKVCKNPDGTGSCVSTKTYAGTFYDSEYYVDVPNSSTAQVWYAFVWYDDSTNPIGSAKSPSWHSSGTSSTDYTIDIPAGYTGYYRADLATALRPLKPGAVYPGNGAQAAPTSFTLKWGSGVDAHRVNWPATYDIYAYGNGGTESLIASNISCNPDANGYCTLAVSNLVPNALYYWRVVAKLNIGVYPPNPYYVNESAQFYFRTAVDPNAPTTFMTRNYVNFLTARSCGGSWLDATGTTQGECQKFKVEDVNGGYILSGDVVHLKFANTWYVAAENEGGGAVSVIYTSAITWEKFKIIKISGSPTERIVNGDRVAFMTYDNVHYVRAVDNGGGGVDATSTTVGNSERFVYETDIK